MSEFCRITSHIITNRREISLSFQLDQNSQIQKKVQEHSNPNRFSRTKIQQIQWSLHRFSEIPYWIFIIESVFSAIQARTHHPKAASSSAITEVREEERERSEGSQREIREGERKLTSKDPNQRIRGTSQNLRITDSGNSQISFNHVENHYIASNDVNP